MPQIKTQPASGKTQHITDQRYLRQQPYRRAKAAHPLKLFPHPQLRHQPAHAKAGHAASRDDSQFNM
ncbi:MAG TPA: hypothetical protein DCQ77_08260 [Betaproteobacteria bacterium]|nr:hypothetical protein [Betaproteobacteria bacterium]